MGIAIYDTIDDVISMIKTKWNTGTGGVIPRIERIWDEKTIGFGDQEISKGIILIEAMDESVKYFSLYGVSNLHKSSKSRKYICDTFLKDFLRTSGLMDFS